MGNGGEGGKGFLQGGVGGRAWYYNAVGGFGGGGSYNAGKNQQNECCYNTAGHGQVTITLI